MYEFTESCTLDISADNKVVGGKNIIWQCARVEDLSVLVATR